MLFQRGHQAKDGAMSDSPGIRTPLVCQPAHAPKFPHLCTGSAESGTQPLLASPTISLSHSFPSLLPVHWIAALEDHHISEGGEARPHLSRGGAWEHPACTTTLYINTHPAS